MRHHKVQRLDAAPEAARNYAHLGFDRVHVASPHWYARITARIIDGNYIVAAAGAVEVKERRGGFGG